MIHDHQCETQFFAWAGCDCSADEITRLRADISAKTAECERLLAANKDCMAHFDQMQSDLAASQAECERLRGALNELGVTPEEARAGVERSRANRRDAERCRLVRRGQKWSVINGIGDELRAESLDAAIDAARAGKGE